MTEQAQLLEQAINSNDANKVTRLITEGNIDVNATNEQGYSLLHKAV